MADSPSSDKDKTTGAPAPEVLKPQSESSTSSTEVKSDASKAPSPKRLRRGSYRPSHKATFIGLAVIIAILAINGAVIFFIMRGQNNASAQANREEVTLSSSSLDKLGVSRNAVGDLGTELIVGPNSRFSGNVKIAGNVSIGGQLQLNSKFSASEASLAKLQAGEVSVNSLSINSDLTTGGLNVGRDLAVAGNSRIQGTLTIGQILTVNNSVNVAGNLAIGGALSVRNFQVNTLTIAGHLISTGAAPGVSGGGALGSNGTVSISGNDTAGTIGVNIGVGASTGCLASVSFRERFVVTPHVVVTGSMPTNIYLAGRTSSGFTVCTAGALSPGGYFIDYVVVQ